MFSHLIPKKTLLLCCIFTCLTTLCYTQNNYALSERNKVEEDSSFINEKKKARFFSRILTTVFGKKNRPELTKNTKLNNLSKKLDNIKDRITRVSQQKYNVEHSHGNKHSLVFNSTQLKRILDRLSSQRNMITKQISTFEKNKQLFTKNKNTLNTKNSTIHKNILNRPKPILSDTNPIKTVSNIASQGISNKKMRLNVKVVANNEVKQKNKIVNEQTIETDTKENRSKEKLVSVKVIAKNEIIKSIGKEVITNSPREEVKNNENFNEFTIPAEIEKYTLSQSAGLQAANTLDKIELTRTNKEIKFAIKTSLIEEIKEETVKIALKPEIALPLTKDSVKSIAQLKEKDILEKNSVISDNEDDLESNITFSEKMANQIREMVVDNNTEEIRMALNNGDSVGVIRVLVEKNITREDLTTTERDTINDYIAILGKIGSGGEEDIKFLSNIKNINRKLDDYYTHNIYSAIWKLKKKQGRNKIETREDFDNAIDYISYIFNIYKSNTNEKMQLYRIEVDFLSEIIEALSNSGFAQESVPLLAKLMTFENKNFVNFISKTIDKIFNSIEIENSERVVADFKP